MKYISTRGGQRSLSFYEAILQGIACDGGLLVPDSPLPVLNPESLIDMDYIELATELISIFVPEGDKEKIHATCKAAYGSHNFPEGVVPVKKVGKCHVAELFHGRTAAFKDMALSLLPHLMTLSMKELGEEKNILILTATSGDTGKAALEGFRDVEGINIVVYYPTDGVSAVQKKQMISQEGNNVKVIGIRGNFDDAQRAVKEIFVDESINSQLSSFNYKLSSANSINIGRLLPQMVYYWWSYLEMVRQDSIKMGCEIDVVVPSGNFGNCLAAWMAKQMGLPVRKFVVASNRNNVLTDFFNTGVYDTHREFYKTNAPAMDILVSSNIERLLWFVSNGNSELVADLMAQLKETGIYKASLPMSDMFSASFSDEQQILNTIHDCWRQNRYLLDTHTACAYAAIEEALEVPTLIVSTASPYKFPDAVWKAISGESLDDYEATDKLLKETGVAIPQPLQGIKERPVIHKDIINKEDIPHSLKFLLS